MDTDEDRFASHVYHGDYTGALAKLKKLLLFYRSKSLNLVYVLDGESNPYKAPEDVRRKPKREAANAEISAAIQAGHIPDTNVYRKSVTITSRYIALAARLLEFLKLPFIVAPGEADGQLVALATDGIVISRDFDMLALGAKCKIEVDNGGGWHTGGATKVLSLSLLLGRVLMIYTTIKSPGSNKCIESMARTG